MVIGSVGGYLQSIVGSEVGVGLLSERLHSCGDHERIFQLSVVQTDHLSHMIVGYLTSSPTSTCQRKQRCVRLKVPFDRLLDSRYGRVA